MMPHLVSVHLGMVVLVAHRVIEVVRGSITTAQQLVLFDVAVLGAVHILHVGRRSGFGSLQLSGNLLGGPRILRSLSVCWLRLV